MRRAWTDLPDTVTQQLAERLGSPHAVPAVGGDHAEIAATVTGSNSTAFVKAACSDLGVRSLRYELRVGEALHPPHSPAVLWHFESDGWLVGAFEPLDGRHADLSPGSPDLDLLARAITTLGRAPEPDLPLFTPQARLGFSHPAMNGASLVHTDLNPANVIVTRDGLRIVDWAYATRAASWVELALLVQWLIGSGHAPEQAEYWLAQFPAWGEVDGEVLDHFAASNAGKWAGKATERDEPWIRDLAVWSRRWAEIRR